MKAQQGQNCVFDGKIKLSEGLNMLTSIEAELLWKVKSALRYHYKFRRSFKEKLSKEL
jgi:hypothetical protein